VVITVETGLSLLVTKGIKMKYYSPSTKGFYTPEINDFMPNDVVEITDEHWQSLLGEEIVFDGVKPIVRVFTPEEISEKNQKEQAVVAAKQSVLNKLAALGLSQDEISLLVP
jgi:hypothetical protein